MFKQDAKVEARKRDLGARAKRAYGRGSAYDGDGPTDQLTVPPSLFTIRHLKAGFDEVQLSVGLPLHGFVVVKLKVAADGPV